MSFRHAVNRSCWRYLKEFSKLLGRRYFVHFSSPLFAKDFTLSMRSFPRELGANDCPFMSDSERSTKRNRNRSWHIHTCLWFADCPFHHGKRRLQKVTLLLICRQCRNFTCRPEQPVPLVPIALRSVSASPFFLSIHIYSPLCLMVMRSDLYHTLLPLRNV